MKIHDEPLDLDNPKDAKFFLRGVRIKGKQINCVTLEDGKTLSIEDMTASELVRYAKDIYIDYCGGVEGKEGMIQLVDEAREQ